MAASLHSLHPKNFPVDDSCLNISHLNRFKIKLILNPNINFKGIRFGSFLFDKQFTCTECDLSSKFRGKNSKINTKWIIGYREIPERKQPECGTFFVKKKFTNKSLVQFHVLWAIIYFEFELFIDSDRIIFDPKRTPHFSMVWVIHYHFFLSVALRE